MFSNNIYLFIRLIISNSSHFFRFYYVKHSYDEFWRNDDIKSGVFPVLNPYETDETQVVPLPDSPFPIQRLPSFLMDRFIELLPGLSAHKLSFTNKKIYQRIIKKNGIRMHISTLPVTPTVFSDGSIQGYLTEIPDDLDSSNIVHGNLISHVKVESFHVWQYGKNFIQIMRRLRFVAKKPSKIQIVTDYSGKKQHLQCLHPGIIKANINFEKNCGNLEEILEFLPNVKDAKFNFSYELDWNFDNTKDEIKNWLKTKSKSIKNLCLDFPNHQFYFFDNKFFEVPRKTGQNFQIVDIL
uniref:F-box domain-containing protein n=1 Tax=Panagrolaimus sp. JU765 TaxID=591449 RepID=A0AC34QIE7_9BILA